eukprot:9743681-Lingulodinium_polyedra.AAC.1
MPNADVEQPMNSFVSAGVYPFVKLEESDEVYSRARRVFQGVEARALAAKHAICALLDYA